MRNIIISLYFPGEIWYNAYMKSTNDLKTSNPDMVTFSRTEYEEKNARLAFQDERISHLESQIELLTEALRLARHKRFGASSEKTDESGMEQLSFLFNEAEVFSAAEKEEPEVTNVAGHKRHKKHTYTLDTIPEGIPTRQVEHRLKDEALVCPQCGDTMTEIGKEVVKTLEIVPAQYIVREDIYYAYACKSCGENADEGCEAPVVKAPREKNIIPGSFAPPGSHREHHDPEIRHGFTLVSAGAGDQSSGHPAEPTDRVQLDSESYGGQSGSRVSPPA